MVVLPYLMCFICYCSGKARVGGCTIGKDSHAWPVDPCMAACHWECGLVWEYLSLFWVWHIILCLKCVQGFPGGSMVKNLPARAGNIGLIPRSGSSPGEGHAAHSSVLAWRLPWTEECGRLYSMRSQRAGLDWQTKQQQQYVCIMWHLANQTATSEPVGGRRSCFACSTGVVCVDHLWLRGKMCWPRGTNTHYWSWSCSVYSLWE